MQDSYGMQLASFVIEASSNWREVAGNILANHHVHIPHHACVAKPAAAEGMPVFLAPSSTTGTLIATGRFNDLVAAVAPWTMESGSSSSAFNSSVQLTSCVARRVTNAFDGASAAKSFVSDDTGWWVCDADDSFDLPRDLSSECASAAVDDYGRLVCHVVVRIIVTAAAIPPWAAGCPDPEIPCQYSKYHSHRTSQPSQ
jgi:hypothetical protein